MLGHRTLTVEDYITILKRRWWIIALPAIILPIVAVAVTFFIPPEYTSSTLVLIDQQKVPEDIVKPVVTEDLNSRLASMREQIMSRSTLQPIIEKYNLYASKRLDVDARIEMARKAIDIQLIQSEIRANGLPGFKIFFTADDPHTAQQVCSEITSLFTSANLRQRAAYAEGTTSFLKQQLDEAKRTLDEQDKKLADFKRQYVGMLPEDEAGNVNILNTLNSRLDATTQQVNSLEQNQSVLDAMLSQQSQAAASGAPTAGQISLQQRQLEDLQAQEAQLSAHYPDDYPDLKEVRRKVADLQKAMSKVAANPAPVAPAPVTHVDNASTQQLRAQLNGLKMAIQSKRKEQEGLQAEIRGYQGKIQASPQVEQEEKELTRDYQTAQNFYDSLLAKMNQSQMATDLEHRQEGETFNVLDQPNLPDSPKWPKQSVFAMGGLAGGLAIGLAIVALLEYRDTALRSERDIWAFTQLPTLAVIGWSGAALQGDSEKPGLFKRLFRRKTSRKLLADAPG